MKSKQQRLDMYNKLSRELLGIEKIEPSGTDRLDFYNVHVSNLTEAFERVYEQGFLDGSKYLP